MGLRRDALITTCFLCCISLIIIGGRAITTGDMATENHSYAQLHNNLRMGVRNLTNTYLSRHTLKAGRRPRAGCTCGVKRQNTVKIVGGNLSKENAWPWLAPLVLFGNNGPQQFCGSSLIASNYVLTAAHCVYDLTINDQNNVRVYLGTNVINSTDSIRSAVSSIRIHPSFDSKTLDYDIALIKLAQPVQFSERVKSICLQQVGVPFVGRVAIVSGWGALKNGGPSVNRLRQVKLKVIGNPECVKSYAADKIKVTQNMMCATLPKKDSCQGDSGGPMFIYYPSTKSFNQIGIVSFGRGCGDENFPGVYTRVNRFMQWIRENTQDGIYCDGTFV